ncbi:MAG: YerC/YecD family TrpR-related protein [Patescibacteria group bacterium]
MLSEKMIKSKEIDELYKAVLLLKNLDEARRFFRDLLTREEIEEIAGRWQVVRMIDQGIPYRNIAEKTGVSTATITRVARWLKEGMGGYRLMLDRLASK